MLLSVALVASACSSGSSGKVSVVRSSTLGASVLEIAGRPVYVHLLSNGEVATCDNACLTQWPAVDVSAVPPAERGVNASLLSSTVLAGGTRVLTYDGHVLYYFYNDTTRHVTAQGIESFDGFWYAVSPSGKPIVSSSGRSSVPAPSKSSY